MCACVCEVWVCVLQAGDAKFAHARILPLPRFPWRHTTWKTGSAAL